MALMFGFVGFQGRADRGAHRPVNQGGISAARPVSMASTSR